MEYKFKWTNIWHILSPVPGIALKIMTCLNVIRLNRHWIHELGLGKSLRGKKKNRIVSILMMFKITELERGSFFFFFSIMVYYRILYIVSCAIQ